MQIFLHISACVLLLFALRAQAGTDCDPSDHTSCVEVGSWQFSIGVGAGVRTNPLVDAEDIPLVLIPQLSYQGERFFIENLDIGFIAAESNNQQLNLLITPSYDQVFFHRWDAGNFFISSNGLGTSGSGGEFVKEDDEELPVIDQDPTGGVTGPEFSQRSWRDLDDRHMAGLAGVEYNLTFNELELQLQYLQDVTKVHDGDEARMVIAKPWSRGKQRMLVSLGLNWQSQAVIQYYYGVSEEEADSNNRYTATDGISQIIRVDWNYKLTDSWDLRVLASVRHLPDAISASPLVNDNKVITAFVGGVYHF